MSEIDGPELFDRLDHLFKPVRAVIGSDLYLKGPDVYAWDSPAGQIVADLSDSDIAWFLEGQAVTEDEIIKLCER